MLIIKHGRHTKYDRHAPMCIAQPTKASQIDNENKYSGPVRKFSAP